MENGSSKTTGETNVRKDHKGDELRLKSEFLQDIQDDENELSYPKKAVDGENETNGAENNGDKSKKKRQKGQNKNRPPPMKFDRKQRLCPILVDVTEEIQELPKCTFPNCSFQHDVQAYLDNKPPDLEAECHAFKMYGHCPRGVTCKFGQAHILREQADDGTIRIRNKINREIREKFKDIQLEKNHLSADLKHKLRKNQINFKECDQLVDKLFKEREARKALEEAGDKASSPPQKRVKVDDNDDHVVESDVESLFPEKRKIDWEGKLYLAPLTTVGNLPFRRVCKQFGADITCGEMAMGLQLLQGHQPEWALVQRHHSEDIFGIQVCGSSPQQMTRVAKLVEEYIDCDFVDINLGCPIDLVYKKGMGSGLMGRKKPLEVMVRSMSQVLTRPLTVKMRTGIYMDKRIAHNLIPEVRDWGAAMVTLHGRSREQRYTRLADWQYIGECVEAAKPMPLFGNGDIMNYEEYNAQKKLSNVSGIMIARGALIKPWIFTEIKEQRHWDISAVERFDMIKDFANFGLDHWGSDDKGVETTRRFLLEWLSFLHRYIPHGMLLEPPQKINQRIPPKFCCRSDLENLLSSSKCSDWVKITEMLLGKVPDGFSFEPKHKANAYK